MRKLFSRIAMFISILAVSGLVATTAPQIVTAQDTPRYLTLPNSTDFPPIEVTTPASQTADGLIFMAPIRIDDVTEPYLIILDNAGEPVYIQKFAPGSFIGNVKPFTVNGKQVLTYFHGTSAAPGWVTGKTYVLDEKYQVIDTWDAQNGYQAELHDFQLLDNGHAVIAIYNPLEVDMTAYGGQPDATVLEFVIQELDAERNVVFEWHSDGVIPYTDSYIDLTTALVDYIHGNSVIVDTDGNFLVSARNTSELIKISRTTGQVLWRLGGKGNQFTFTNDSGFTAQHDAQRTATGTITLFDNGFWNHPTYSRAVEYEVDEQNKTVTRVWEYRSNPDIYGAIMGSTQRLPNGNTFIGWGSGPVMTEVAPNGTKVFEARHETWSGYRAYRYPWSGTPAIPPALAVTTTSLAISWNGATDVAAYQIFGGPTPQQHQLLSTVARQGFETVVPLNSLSNASAICSVKIRPIDAQGKVLAESATVAKACDGASHQVLLPIVRQEK